MGIEVVWENEDKDILRYDIQGRWTWADLRQALDKIFMMMDSAPAPRIGTIAHFIEDVVIPRDALMRMNEFTGRSHPKAGLTVVVGAGKVMKTAFAALKHAATLGGRPVEFAYADTLEEARALIKEDLTRKQKNPKINQ